MVRAAFFQVSCWIFKFQLRVYGVFRFLAMPKTGQGKSVEQLTCVGSRLPKIGNPFFQLKLISSGSGSRVVALIVPPPGPTGAPGRPLGLRPMPNALVLF